MQHEIIKSFLRLSCSLGFLGIFAIAGLSESRSAKPVSGIATAQAEISHGNLDSAEQKLWTILSSEPNQPEALALLGVIRGRQKRYPEAEALLRRVLQLDPKSLPAHRNLANALIAQNKPDAAITEYVELIKLAPRDNLARIDLAHLYLARGQFADALSSLEAIPPGQFPADAIPAKAASLLGVGKTAEAAALIPRAKQSPAGVAELAEVFLEGNAPQYALRIVDAEIRRSSRAPALIYYLKGRAQRASGNSAGAQKSFQNALSRDPKSVDTLLNIAEIYASQNQHPESLALLKRANALQPHAPETLRPLIIEAMKTGDNNTALNAAHLLADDNSGSLDDQYLSAAVMLEGKDFVTASSIFTKYVQQRPEDSKGFLGLGIAELAQQHTDEAWKALEKSLQIDPNQPDAEYHLAMVAAAQGDSAEELKHLERAIELQPQHAKALAALGDQYLQAGDLEKARSALERSVAGDPNNYKSQYDLALALAKTGDAEAAKQHMERSHALKAADDAGKNPGATVGHP
ncbi:MAG: hypothetical protein QOJ41_1696 [Acidobacteriaceae bacterium]|nr:hypothetical protein [Acidobacteriaceae bacterium]